MRCCTFKDDEVSDGYVDDDLEVAIAQELQYAAMEALKNEYVDVKHRQLFDFAVEEEDEICNVKYIIGQGIHRENRLNKKLSHSFDVTHDPDRQSCLITLYVGHKGEEVVKSFKDKLHSHILQHPGYRNGRRVKAAIVESIQQVDEWVCSFPDLQQQAGSIILMVRQQNRFYVGGLGSCRAVLQEFGNVIGPKYLVKENSPEDLVCDAEFRNSGGQLTNVNDKVWLTNFQKNEFWDVSKCLGAANFKQTSTNKAPSIISNEMDVQLLRVSSKTRYLLLTCGDSQIISGRGIDWMIDNYLNYKVDLSQTLESITYRMLNKPQSTDATFQGVINALILFDKDDYDNLTYKIQDILLCRDECQGSRNSERDQYTLSGELDNLQISPFRKITTEEFNVVQSDEKDDNSFEFQVIDKQYSGDQQLQWMLRTTSDDVCNKGSIGSKRDTCESSNDDFQDEYCRDWNRGKNAHKHSQSSFVSCDTVFAFPEHVVADLNQQLYQNEFGR
eukprot:TRINITY_DN9927_c0_g1_i6.p1 TRINITY_DN9927_c0_g1~~TRINITY_DN9927_c0_g1_i6.p1  ORF type:complete len:501 (+),score=62.61 TRINITY_DN9927_c0_g1_i6:133-1635(+)